MSITQLHGEDKYRFRKNKNHFFVAFSTLNLENVCIRSTIKLEIIFL